MCMLISLAIIVLAFVYIYKMSPDKENFFEGFSVVLVVAFFAWWIIAVIIAIPLSLFGVNCPAISSGDRCYTEYNQAGAYKVCD